MSGFFSGLGSEGAGELRRVGFACLLFFLLPSMLLRDARYVDVENPFSSPACRSGMDTEKRRECDLLTALSISTHSANPPPRPDLSPPKLPFTTRVSTCDSQYARLISIVANALHLYPSPSLSTQRGPRRHAKITGSIPVLGSLTFAAGCHHARRGLLFGGC